MSEEQSFNYKYIYHDVTKELLRTQEVEYDHRGNEIKYPCETFIEPPECNNFEIQIFNESLQQWSIVEDHRGRSVYLDGNTWVQWQQLGPLPEYATTEFMDGYNTLAEAKEAVLYEIKRYRDNSKYSGFEYNGNVYDSDQNSFMSLSAYESTARTSIMEGTVFEPVMWITKDNKEVALDANDFINIMKAYSDHVSRVNAHAVNLKKFINDVQISDGIGSLKARERDAIAIVTGHDLSFRDVLPEGCDPVDTRNALLAITDLSLPR